MNFLQLDGFLIKNYSFLLMVFLTIVIAFSFVILACTIYIHEYFESADFKRCRCIETQANRIKLSKYLNETCTAMPIDLNCFKDMGQVKITCVESFKWYRISRVVVSVETIVNVLIAVTVWRSPHFPNFISLFCCTSAILSAYGDHLWVGYTGELVTFVGSYVMLYYGIFPRIKIT